MRKLSFRAILAVVILSFPALALAAPSNPLTNLNSDSASFGIFNSIATDFSTALAGWYQPIYQAAVSLFTLLALLEITWLGATWLLSRKTFEDAIPSLVKKIITLGFFLAILLHSGTWIPDIINSFSDLGLQAGGMSSISPSQIAGEAGAAFMAVVSGGAGSLSVTPAGGWSWNPLHDVAGEAVTQVNNVGGMLISFIVAFVLFFALLYIAVEFLIVQIESMIVLSGGVIMLAGGGSRWTAKYVQPYIDYAISVGLRLMIITLVVAVFQNTLIRQLGQMMSQTTGNGGNLFNGVEAIGVAFIMAMLAKKLPNIASSILSGNSSMTGQEVYGSMAKTAAAGAAVVAGGAVAGAAGVSALAGGATAGGMGAGGAGGGGGTVAGGMAPSASTASAAQGVAAPSTPLASGSAAEGGPSAAGVPAPKAAASDGGSSGPSASEMESTATTSSTTLGPLENRQIVTNTSATDHSGGSASGSSLPAGSPSRGTAGGGSGTAVPTGATPPMSGNPGVQAGGSAKGSGANDSGTPPSSTFQRAQDAAKTTHKVATAAHEHLSPDVSGTSGVAAPGGGAKHLDD